ncbi:Mitochondrial import inner membrane translocase subunit TIM44 [Perkinsus olseni]|uniref:Mitochondrial import inner membrane translocase subunit TIM44 n=1 Tax=Perkinsus olseni TaxID=32597 RepID=A0A7J6LS09_PEROL|nr:Mitochondrial import inner membrane translocase subunit TIM44 [Perkinsus olseni]
MTTGPSVEDQVMAMVSIADKRVRAMNETAAEADFESAPTPRLWSKDMPNMKVGAVVNVGSALEETLTEEYFSKLLSGGASVIVLDTTKGVFTEGVNPQALVDKLNMCVQKIRAAGKGSGVNRPFSLALSVGNNELAKLCVTKVAIPRGIGAVIIPPVRTGAEVSMFRSSVLGMRGRRIKIFVHTTTTKNIEDFLPTVDGIIVPPLTVNFRSICASANLAGKLVITDCGASPVGNLMAAVSVQSDTALLPDDAAAHAAATIHTLEGQASTAAVSFSCSTGTNSVVGAVVERAIAMQMDSANNTKLIVAFSDDGTTAAMLSRMRPTCKILAMSASEAVINFFTTLWGVEPLQTASYQSAEAVIQNVKDFCKETGLAASGGSCLLTGSAFFSTAHAARTAVVIGSRARQQPPRTVSQQRNNSSFIRQVMEQVRREAESDPKLKKAFEEVEKTASRVTETNEQLRARADAQEAKLAAMREKMQSAKDRTKSLYEELRKHMPEGGTPEAGEAAKRTTPEWMKPVLEQLSMASARAREATSTLVDKASGFTRMMDKESSQGVEERLKQFQRAQAAMRDLEKDKEMREKAAEDPTAEPLPENPHGSALVVSERAQSTWERFGFTSSEDSRFLGGFFENPMVDRIFGETEIAQSIREMKETDPNFRLSQMAEDIEHVVAPRIIRWYLEGDVERLEAHCGEAAFAAVNASVNARHTQKLTLDTNILQPPMDVELKGAKTASEVDSPCFIFTFSTQQVNCLRNEFGEVVEGAVDDIRRVFYAMAVQKHPEPESRDLEHPWRIQELAIIGNQPSWVLRIRGFASKGTSRGEKKNFYDILGIEQKATGEEVKEAYREMAKKWHPDRNPDDPLAADKFKEVCEAYATLGNQWKRTIYDQDMQFGAALDSQAKGEDWKEHYNKETPEQRNARRERYRRYAKGERNDVPQDEMPLSMMIKLLIAVPVVVWIGCILAPEFGPGERPSEPSRNDPGFDDKSVPLTRAYYNPILERWEKLKGVEEPPDPEKFYDVHLRDSPGSPSVSWQDFRLHGPSGCRTGSLLGILLLGLREEQRLRSADDRSRLLTAEQAHGFGCPQDEGS